MPAFAVQPQAPAFAGRAGRCSGTPAVRLRSRPAARAPRAAAGHWPSVSPRQTRRAYHHRRRSWSR
jgi:hypothetical protein